MKNPILRRCKCGRLYEVNFVGISRNQCSKCEQALLDEYAEQQRKDDEEQRINEDQQRARDSNW